MKIESCAFGPQVDDPETRIVFPRGIPGFEESRGYQLFQHAAGDLVGYLQSVDDPELTLSVISPESLNIFYEFTLRDEEQELLQLERPEDVVLLVLAYRQPATGGGADPRSPQVNANFMAPLVINLRTRLGLQKVLGRTERRVTIKAD